MDNTNLRFLCLDGGGVRGLSSLFILRHLMRAIAPDAKNPPQPWQYFHIIGGTSTGGLIAIMLGRLRMSVDDCIEKYTALSEKVFQKKRSRIKLTTEIQGRFDTAALEKAVKECITGSEHGLDEKSLLYDTNTMACKVFVCATSKDTRDTTVFTSYISKEGYTDLLESATIWQAARATSAASTFFEPITIGPHREQFVDGAFGANNPVKVMWEQAKYLFSERHLAERTQCIICIGTGEPGVAGVGDKLREVIKTLGQLATESQNTARDFEEFHDVDLVQARKYYRFNVDHGLQGVGLEEYKEEAKIVAATRMYLRHNAQEKLSNFVAQMQGVSFAESRAIDPESLLAPPQELEASSRATSRSGRATVPAQQQSHYTEHFIFHTLTDKPEHINRREAYPWRKLTVAAWDIYEHMYESMPKTSDGRVDRLSFEAQIPVGPLRQQVPMYWLLLKARPDWLLPKCYAMALLFMLHLRSALNHAWAAISEPRLFILRRFADWVACSCGCGREWNFANDLGIVRLARGRSEGGKCSALEFNQAGAWRRRMLGAGKVMDGENRDAWKARSHS